MEWQHGSSGRAPALQVRSPEFKPQSHKKKKKHHHHHNKRKNIIVSTSALTNAAGNAKVSDQ
jgi:hypothetical protein